MSENPELRAEIEVLRKRKHPFTVRAVIKRLREESWLTNGALRGFDLSDISLFAADLMQADLTDADLHNANLRGASLYCAQLTGARLTGASFEESDLQYVALDTAAFDPETTLPDGQHWTPNTDLARFTNPGHPDFWRSANPSSPAFCGFDAVPQLPVERILDTLAYIRRRYYPPAEAEGRELEGLQTHQDQLREIIMNQCKEDPSPLLQAIDRFRPDIDPVLERHRGKRFEIHIRVGMCHDIVRMLGELGDPRSTDRLKELLHDSHVSPFSRQAAAQALERIGTPDAIEAAQLWRAKNNRLETLTERLEYGRAEDALQAAAELKDLGWLQDGTFRRSYLWCQTEFFPNRGWQRASLAKVDFRNADLARRYFGGIDLESANLEGAFMLGIWLADAHLQKANLAWADLRDADLRRADLRCASLVNANLEAASLIEADFRGAQLSDANLEGANLSLHDLGFRTADPEAAVFNEETVIPDGTNWVPGTDMKRFTDPDHPDFWRSDDPNSPAYVVGSE